MRFKAAICILLFTLLSTFQITSAQTPTTYQTSAFRRVFVFAGPGATHDEVGFLNPGVPVTIVERNRLGNWVRINMISADGSVALDGWVISGYLNQDANLHYSQIPVNEDIPDANPAHVGEEPMERLYRYPVIPYISTSMRSVFELGQLLGNHANVATKIGDSVSANEMYLDIMSQPEHDLGPYDYLADTLAFFGAGASESVAARIGLTTYVVFDPFWADDELCETGETPIDCEFRRKQPSVALILFGQNDVRHMTADEYHEQMELIVEDSLEHGVIPVLMTFSADPNEELWWQAIDFNLALADVAAEYDVPLVNLWLASRTLPEYGLEQDGIHMQNSGFTYLKYTSGHEAFYGTSLQNLLALRVLDELRRTLNMDGSAS